MSWPKKLLAREDFDDRQKGTIMGMLAHYQLEGGHPDALFKGSEQQVRLTLDGLLADAAVSGGLQPHDCNPADSWRWTWMSRSEAIIECIMFGCSHSHSCSLSLLL